ncbi:hypothetical protein FS842_006322, partial [Serendipita sp. 407]
MNNQPNVAGQIQQQGGTLVGHVHVHASNAGQEDHSSGTTVEAAIEIDHEYEA